MWIGFNRFFRQAQLFNISLDLFQDFGLISGLVLEIQKLLTDPNDRVKRTHGTLWHIGNALEPLALDVPAGYRVAFIILETVFDRTRGQRHWETDVPINYLHQS